MEQLIGILITLGVLLVAVCLFVVIFNYATGEGKRPGFWTKGHDGKPGPPLGGG